MIKMKGDNNRERWRKDLQKMRWKKGIKMNKIIFFQPDFYISIFSRSIKKRFYQISLLLIEICFILPFQLYKAILPNFSMNQRLLLYNSKCFKSECYWEVVWFFINFRYFDQITTNLRTTFVLIKNVSSSISNQKKSVVPGLRDFVFSF